MILIELDSTIKAPFSSVRHGTPEMNQTACVHDLYFLQGIFSKDAVKLMPQAFQAYMSHFSTYVQAPWAETLFAAKLGV